MIVPPFDRTITDDSTALPSTWTGWTLSTLKGLLSLGDGALAHLGPLYGRVGDELSGVGARATERGPGRVGDPRLQLGIGEPCVDLLVAPVDDVGGRVPWCAHALQRAGLVAGDEVGQ